jgi:hypothetical protein
MTSEKNDRCAYDTYIQLPVPLPFGLRQAMICHLAFDGYWPSLPRIRLRQQRIIPSDSEIILACSNGAIPRAEMILRSGDAHPNDRTPDNITVFRVSHSNVPIRLFHVLILIPSQHAVRTGNRDLVKLLLKHGADPNLTFGNFDTYVVVHTYVQQRAADHSLGVL